jgi:hypothetical protein
VSARTAKPELDSGNWYVLLTGIPAPAAAIRLADGLTLRPLEESLSIFDLAAAGAAGFRQWAALEPVAPAATCEIETAVDAAVSPGYDTLNRAWLAVALLVLRGFTRLTAPACSAYSWGHIAGHQAGTGDVFKQQLREEGLGAAIHPSRRALPKFSGGLLDYQLRLISTSKIRHDPLGPEDETWLCTHYETFNRIAAEDEAFRFALEAAVDWRYGRDHRTALARLWSGIEAIFGISSELVYRISSLSASLLEPRGERRKARFKEVRQLYGARSKAVHGDKISEAKLAGAVDGSFQLLADLLLLALARGRPLSDGDFEAALFD